MQESLLAQALVQHFGLQPPGVGPRRAGSSAPVLQITASDLAELLRRISDRERSAHQQAQLTTAA